jgi:hypothetical protein
MRTLRRALLAVPILAAAPLWAGGMWLQIGNPAANPEATAKQAVLVARITACHSPEKTALTATAEGLTNSGRQSIPLKVIPLSKPDSFAVTREWPQSGEWVVKIVATNPEYKNYATSVLIPMGNDSFNWTAVKYYPRAPTTAEVDAALGAKLAAVARK